MSGEPVQIGPFIGGLNSFSDPSSVSDDELVVCENFELDLDGSLVSRPPITSAGSAYTLGVTGNVLQLGYFYAPGGVAYLLVSDGLSNTSYFNGTSFVLVTATIAASAMVQFDNKAYLLAPEGSTNPGGYWTPGGGFVADANMPKGNVIVAHKLRLWVAVGKDATANGTRLYFSKVLGTVPIWPAVPDFIDVGGGDGQNIVQITVYYNSLLLFRSASIYSFQYSSDPASGVVSLVVPGVGITDKNCLVPFENYLYFMYDNKAYEFINNRASHINVKAPFQSVSRAGIYLPYAVSKFNRRIIFSYWDVTYVFSLRTRTWTTWKSPTTGAIGAFTELDDAADDLSAIGFSSAAVATGGTRLAAPLLISDTISAVAENFTCTMQTKNYNYEVGSAYKRLWWWGVEAVFRGVVRGTAVPIAYTQQAMWGQVAAQYTWAQLLGQTWGALTSDTYAVETIRDTSGSGSMRKFVKAGRGLRFRQIYFRVQFDTDGSTSTAPVRLFLLMTYVRAKERVSKPVT